jgi:phage terminase large subunit-like protein
MAYYLVTAKPVDELLPELRQKLDNGDIQYMHPFGPALQYSLENARLQENGEAIWEEEDYCSPPLAQERAAVLDKYFRDLNIERVEKNTGWKQIDLLPGIWRSL